MRLKNLVVENAQIGFRNFRGQESKFTPKGRRTFVIFFDVQTGEELEELGWNVRWLDARDKDEDPTPFIEVRVNYNNIPPNVVLISGTTKTYLNEETIDVLDWADIETADVIATPYHWEINGKIGVTAYLKTMYITIIRDEFAHKYENLGEDEDDILDLDIASDDVPF